MLDVSTGWYDAGIVNGQNKLVPVVSFKLKNVSDQTLVSLQVNGLFRRVAEKDEWGSGFITAAGSDGLAPGATTPTLTIKSQLGYTGTEPRQEMLQQLAFRRRESRAGRQVRFHPVDARSANFPSRAC